MGTVKELLDIARGELGTKESPAGSNRVQYNTWYYGREVSGPDYPWCVTFVQWVFARAGVALPVRTASCGALMRSAPVAGCWVYGDYRPGDVVIYDFPGGAATDHCGIVERVASGTVTAIEGNTGAGSDADGGQVQRRTRKLGLVVGAVRPVYEEENTVRYRYLKDIPASFRGTIEALMDAGIILGDGSDPGGNGDIIDLSHDQVRTLVFLYRGGGFDPRLRAAGLEPAVK